MLTNVASIRAIEILDYWFLIGFISNLIYLAKVLRMINLYQPPLPSIKVLHIS